ncbi:MAG: hypothetical protein UH080_07000 [Ruminococcus sp.]|nr:hypothetical protein [Ruminococcus sp.]
MINSDVLSIILTSTVLSTGMTVIFNLLSNKRKDSIENITKERKEWRGQLREISKSIEKSESIRELKIAISDLKVRINAYGIANNSVFNDSHLWQLIQELETRTEVTNDELLNYKRMFVNLISCNLKYDWERSKAEIKGNKQTIVLIISLVFSFVMYSVKWFYGSGESGIINEYFSYCVAYMLVVVYALLVIYYADRWKDKDTLIAYIVVSAIFGISLCLGILFYIPNVCPNEPVDTIVYLAPYITLIYCTEIKLLLYKRNVSNYIIALAISLGYNVIDKKYKIFIGKRKLQNICTGEIIEFK